MGAEDALLAIRSRFVRRRSTSRGKWRSCDFELGLVNVNLGHAGDCRATANVG